MNLWRRNTLAANPVVALEIVGESQEREFQDAYKKAQSLEHTSRQLNKEVKKYNEVITSLQKTECHLATELGSCAQIQDDCLLHAQAESYMSVTQQMADTVTSTATLNQKLILEPLKNYNVALAGLANNVKKRDSTFQEYGQLQQKLQKVSDKEKTGSNIAKMSDIKKHLGQKKEEFLKQNNTLLTDIKQFEEKNGEYFSPCLQAFVHGQTELYGETVRLCNALLKDDACPGIATKEYLSTIEGIINDINTLDIVISK